MALNIAQILLTEVDIIPDIFGAEKEFHRLLQNCIFAARSRGAKKRHVPKYYSLE